MRFSSQEAVDIVSGDRRIRGTVTEVKVHTGIYEVLVKGVFHYFYIKTEHSIESDAVWIEPATIRSTMEEQQKGSVLSDDEITASFHSAREAFVRDNQTKVVQIARQLCVCDLSCRPTVAESLDLCVKAKHLKAILRQFAISKDAEPSASMIAAIRKNL